MPLTLKIGTRPSPLALKQVEEVRALLPRILIEEVPIMTRGDKDKVSLLPDKEESDFFTYEIERALLSGIIDAAVHSAKDLESDMPEDLVIAAVTPSISPFECLVSKSGLSLEGLAAGAVVGTSSRKRKEAVLRFRPDLAVRDIRGNIEERLRQMDEGKYDAVIVAHAALIRLGLEERISRIIPEEVMAPHPLQGRLVIQARKDRTDLIGIFGRIDAKR